MSDIIETLLLRNLQEVFGEGDPARRRAAIEDFYAEVASFSCPLAAMLGARRSTRSPANCAPVIRPSSTRRTPPRRWSRTVVASPGAPGRPGRPRYTGLDLIIARNGSRRPLRLFELAAGLKIR